jgi:23S rRNA A1618 N6-methylase RlmF
MPSTSKKQHNFMAAVANNPAFAKKADVPQSVGQEFMKADKGKKFGTGTRADAQAINKPKVHRGKMELFARGGEVKESKAMVKKEIGFMKKAGAPRSMIKHEESEMKGMKKMATGGITKAKMGAVPTAAPSRDGLAVKGKTKGTQVKMAASKPLGMKKGGKAYGGKC